LNRGDVLIPRDDFMAAVDETTRHVAAHAAESDETYLHG
jgi:hypothetical protein